MPRYRVTNRSASSAKGKRTVFLVEAGKTLKPGDWCVTNRIDPGTRSLEDDGTISIEEGNFDKPPLFTKEPVAPPLPPTKSAVQEAKRAEKDARAIDERLKQSAVTPTPAPKPAEVIAPAPEPTPEVAPAEEAAPTDEGEASSEDEPDESDSDESPDGSAGRRTRRRRS